MNAGIPLCRAAPQPQAQTPGSPPPVSPLATVYLTKAVVDAQVPVLRHPDDWAAVRPVALVGGTLALGLASLLAGCPLPRLFKSHNPKQSVRTTFRHDPKSGQLTQAALLAEVMSFAGKEVMRRLFCFWV